ncbi:DUF4097 family beta strand repeat-containing protein [Alteromonas lipolytica]|nr:DUF4097 family beta strand repeat-containing protein [Alteromonas lipolytica]
MISNIVKKLCWSAALAGVLLSGNAFAQEKIDKTLDTGSKPFVEMEHVYGKAEIKTWDKNQVRITGKLGSLTEEFTFEKRGNSVVIDVEVKNNHYRWEDDDEAKDDLTVYVPAGSRFAYEALNANVKVDGPQGGTSVEVVNGNIEGRNLGGKVSIESVNGDIELKAITGMLQVEAVNGNIEAEHDSAEPFEVVSVNGKIDLQSVSPEVKVETVNGDSSLQLGEVSDLEMTSVNGDARVSMSLKADADVEVDTVGGSISLTFNKDVSARFEVEAHAGGKIINKLSDDKVNKAKYGPGQWIDFTQGRGNARVRVSTVNGKVTLGQ